MSRQRMVMVAGLLLLTAGPASAAVVCQHKKSGRLAARESACKQKETVFTGALGPTGAPGQPGPAGAQGPPGQPGPVGPTAASYAAFTTGFVNLTSTPAEFARLTGVDGSGALVTTFESRLIFTGSVNVENNGGDGQDAQIACRIELDDGAGFVAVGSEMRTESPGNNNHDERYSIALVAASDQPPGLFDARIMCWSHIAFAGSVPQVEEAALTVVAVGR